LGPGRAVIVQSCFGECVCLRERENSNYYNNVLLIVRGLDNSEFGIEISKIKKIIFLLRMKFEFSQTIHFTENSLIS
jgi:hypothetical protein